MVEVWLGSEAARTAVAELAQYLRNLVPEALEDLMRHVEEARDNGATRTDQRPPLTMDKFHELRQLVRPAPLTESDDASSADAVDAMLHRHARMAEGLPLTRSDRQSLVATLRSHFERGEFLRSTLRFAGMPGAATSSAPVATDDIEVRAWEEQVASALDRYPVLRKSFAAQVPVPTGDQGGQSSQLERRLDEHLRRIEELIRRIYNPAEDA